MGKKFDDIQIGDQLELTYKAGAFLINSNRDINPDAVCCVAIVTNIWYDPVDDKDYVGLAYVRRDGSYGKPTEKRTITGLARCGWRVAGKDYVSLMEAMSKADREKVITMFGRKRK